MIAARLVAVALVLGCPRHETSSPAPVAAPAPIAETKAAPTETEVAPTDTTVEPTTAKVEPATTPTPATADGGPIDDARGLSRKDVVVRWGEPDRKEGARWTYVFPRPPSCTDREIVYVLRIAGDKVASVERSTRQTGKVCAGDFAP